MTPTLALVIPVRDDQVLLDRLLLQAQSMGIFDEIIVVDDGSELAIQVPHEIRLIRPPRSCGPGTARNAGLDTVNSDHVLFFDSDDLLTAELQHLWTDLQSERFDICFFRHADSRSIARHDWHQMATDDAAWAEAGMGGRAMAEMDIAACAHLARSANYPWNRIWRTAFLRDADLRFPEILVHEDIRPHWLGLLRADRVLASDRVCAIHHVSETGDRLTNRRGPERLAAFPVLAEIRAALLREADRGEALLPAFEQFTQMLAEWIRDNLDPTHWPDLDREVAALFPEMPAATTDAPAVLSAPAPASGKRLRIFATGRHVSRMPLSYPALAPLFADSIEMVDHPEAADLQVFAHVIDVEDAPHDVIRIWETRGTPIAILSEEPFWDTIWGKHPLDPLLYVDTRWGTVPVHQLNHATTDIFRFDRIPYYLLTNHRFANAYAHRFARNARRSAAEWQADFAARKVDVCFMFERRPEPYHWVRWDSADIIGLCSWRTELAQACPAHRTERLGRSWDGGRTRFDLDDWHADKLVRLDGRARIMGALENTHQPDYITEKFFDAFACGSVPVYYASPRHRIHDFGLPPESWINLYSMEPEEAASRLADIRPATEAFYCALQTLHKLLAHPDTWHAERHRLLETLLLALARFEVTA